MRTAKPVFQTLTLVALLVGASSLVRGDLPQAPAPRAKPPGKPKTKGELLVGTWRLVKVEGRPRAVQEVLTTQFNVDGSFVFTVTIPGVQNEKRTGTYVLEDDLIKLTSDPDTRGQRDSWDVVIETITEVELVTVAGPPHSRQRSHLKRD